MNKKYPITCGNTVIADRWVYLDRLLNGIEQLTPNRYKS
nr:MAG TPA: hypothetical protein [Caudoviricetes sp.]